MYFDFYPLIFQTHQGKYVTQNYMCPVAVEVHLWVNLVVLENDRQSLHKIQGL
jgi:hypothetical protein